MGYLIPVTPQVFVNRISIFGPDETNIKEIVHFLCDIIKDIDQTDLHRSEPSSRTNLRDEHSHQ